MLDKIRLHAAGRLPADYNRGTGFDARICRFLRVEYASVARIALGSNDDLAVLEWCYSNGRRPSEEEVFVFSEFLAKRGWNDDASPELEEGKKKLGFAGREDIRTFFDLHDADEGRK